jgi:hypothetical protein
MLRRGARPKRPTIAESDGSDEPVPKVPKMQVRATELFNRAAFGPPMLTFEP